MREIKLKNIDYETFDWKKLKDFEIICEGSDDITIIQNYPQRYLYNIRSNWDERELELMGYRIVEGNPTTDSVVLIEKVDKKFHVVKPGETLQKIAEKYKVSHLSLKQLNNVKEVFIGQIIQISK